MTKKITIELTEEQLEKVKELIDLEPNATKAWKPKKGETYYYVTGVSDDNVHECRWDGIKYDTNLWSLGNCYKTEEEAEQADKRQKALIKVLGYIRENFGDWKPDWDRANQDKYHIAYTYHDEKFISSDEYSMQSSALVLPHFQTAEQAQEIINKFEKELRLIWGIE